MNLDSIYSFLRGGGELVLSTEYNRFTCDVADISNSFLFTVAWLPIACHVCWVSAFLVGVMLLQLDLEH